MTTPDLTRRKDLARNHLSKKELGMDDDTYRALLQGLTKKTSAADLNAKERWAVLQEMARLGAPAISMKKPYPGRPVIVRADRADLLRKIEAQLTLRASSCSIWTLRQRSATSRRRSSRPQWGMEPDLVRELARQPEGWSVPPE